MRAVLRCDLREGTAVWDQQWLSAPIAGLPLLQRHLLAFRQAGIGEVTLAGCDDTPAARALVERLIVPGVSVRIAPAYTPLIDEPFVEQRADTLIDPRLVLRLVEWVRTAGLAVECVDDAGDSPPLAAKSPYSVGTPDERDLHALDPADEPRDAIGLAVHCNGSRPVPLHVGRHYWHRVWTPSDLVLATRMVFLGTMKPTDGMYAKANRRVSMRISTRLARTRITANAVTVGTLGVSALAGWLFGLGGYAWTLLGSLVSWFASMLDGVDGELARAKFQASETGRWLEMVCDYLYYVFIFAGMAVGEYRQEHHPMWLALGAASSIGVVLSFVVVARWNHGYLRSGQGRDPGLGFQRTVGSQPGNHAYRFLRRMAVLATRAAMPYYIVAFAVLGVSQVVLVLACVGTNLVWPLVLLVNRPTAPRPHVTRLHSRPAPGEMAVM